MFRPEMLDNHGAPRLVSPRLKTWRRVLSRRADVISKYVSTITAATRRLSSRL